EFTLQGGKSLDSYGTQSSIHGRASSSDFDTLIFLPFGRCPHLFLPQAAVNSTGLLNSASPSGNLFIFPVYRLTSFAACHFQENFVTRSMCSGQNIL
ncbi:MAG: hypothetical protein WA134_16155, partial [Rhodoferax sp.]|uniref:hypothetical protein n=1 Tax=Rhodoferax sp. TaxID=50421 RepID=UPI003BB5E759